MHNINEHILRILGTVNLPEGLENSKRYLLSTEIDVYETADRDNQDGTINRVYKAKQTGKADILTEGKKIIKAEAKRTRSQKMHAGIWYYHNTQGFTESFDDYYDRIMRKMTAYIPEIIEFLDTKSD